VGAFGLLYVPKPWPQPRFDKNGGLYPVFHVLRGLSGHTGSALLAIENSDPGVVQAFAVRRAGVRGVEAREIWIANLTAEPRTVAIEGMRAASVCSLDNGSFAAATARPDLMDHGHAIERASITLDAFAVVRVREAPPLR